VQKTLGMQRFWTVLLVCAAEAGIFWGLFQMAVSQSRRVDAAVTEISDLKDPSPFRVALHGHLDKIELSLSAYLRSPDPAPLKQIIDSRRDFENSLPEFEHQNKRLFPPEASKEILEAYETMKSSLDQAVDVSTRRSEKRISAEENFKQMIYLIDDRIRPLLRRGDSDAKQRLDSILNVENQLRAWDQNLNQAWTESSAAAKALAFENNSRGQSLLEDHSQMMQSSAEKKTVHSLSALWKTNDDLARQNFALEAVQTQALSRFKADHDKLIATLNHLLPAMRPDDVERKKQSILKAIRFRLITTGLMGLFGVLSIAVAIILIYRQWVPPTERSWQSTFEIDLNGSVISWSQKARDLYGYTSDEIRGKSVATLFASESEIVRLHQKMKSGDQTAFETTHMLKGGATIPVRVQFLRMTDKSGQLTAIGLSCIRK